MQQTLLPRAIGLAGYGAFSRVFAVANVVNNVVVASGTQGVSRAVARASTTGHDAEALRATLKVHVGIAIVAAGLFAIAAPGIAAFEHAQYITGPLVVAAGVVACYGVYAPLIGALNGRGQFTRQASLDVTFAVLRTAGLLGVGWLFISRGGSGVLGAAVGFVIAAACIVPLAARWTGTGRASPESSYAPRASVYLAELAPLAIAQLFTNAVMQVDITLLGRFLSESAHATTIADPARAADEWVAVYRACQLFAFLPYQLLFSVTQILFPMIARAKAEGDAAAVRAYVARGARIGAIACGAMVAVIAGLPHAMLAFAFSNDVADRGAGALRVLALGQGAFALLAIATTVLVSLGRERSAATVTFAALVLVSAACAVLVPSQAFGASQLHSTALATSVALALALATAAVLVVREAGSFVPVVTAVRVAIALGIAITCGALLPNVSRVITLVFAAGVALVYLVLLVITRELGAADVSLVMALLGRPKKT